MSTETPDIFMTENTDGINTTTTTTVASTSNDKTPTSSGPTTAIEKLQARIKNARKELEDLYNGDDHQDNTLEAADKISKRISSYENHLNALTDKAVKQLRPVNLRDIPRFQITGQNKHFQDHPSYSSLEYFFSSFETVMHASGNDVELEWKQYIPLSMHYSYQTWTDNDLLQCTTWASAKALFVKHYGVPVNSMELISRLFSMRIQPSGTLQDYTNRFLNNLQEAGFHLGSNTIAKFYQCSLLEKNQQMMVNQM